MLNSYLILTFYLTSPASLGGCYVWRRVNTVIFADAIDGASLTEKIHEKRRENALLAVIYSKYNWLGYQ